MAEMSKRERVEAALQGQPVDRVPVSAWRHFIPDELDPVQLAETTLAHYRTFDWDWIKLNPRATYYSEAWGNRYDTNEYHGVMPHQLAPAISSAADLAKVAVLPSTEPVFDRELRSVEYLNSVLGGEAHFIQTVFSPLSVLGFMAGPTETGELQTDVDGRNNAVRRLIEADPKAVHAALDAIATTLAQYASASLNAGASGLFYALVRNAREGGFTREEYAEWGIPYDLKVLQAVQDAPFNLLHICGSHVHFDIVSNYPVHAINWATFDPGNPSLAEAQKLTNKAIMGGVNEHQTLHDGTPEQIIKEGRQSLAQAGTQRVFLSPGCGIPMDTSDANLHALRQVVETNA